MPQETPSNRIILKNIKRIKKLLQKQADYFWQLDQKSIIGHGNTFEVGVATGIEEAIWHIEQLEDRFITNPTKDAR